MEGAAVTMSELLTSLGAVFTTAMTNVGTVATTIVENPILLFGAAMTFAGFCVGVFKRMFSAA